MFLSTVEQSHVDTSLVIACTFTYMYLICYIIITITACMCAPACMADIDYYDQYIKYISHLDSSSTPSQCLS